MQDFTRVRAELGVTNKIGPDFVSQADLRAEATIKSILNAFAPEYGFPRRRERPRRVARTPISPGSSIRSTAPRTFFGARRSSAPASRSRAAMKCSQACINLPALGEMLWAEKGAGAFMNGSAYPRQHQRRASKTPSSPSASRMAASRDTISVRASEIGRLTPRTTGVRRTGSAAVDLAYAACGRWDAYVERIVAAWDIAAGVGIIIEAGGAVADVSGGPLKLHGGSIVAGAAGLIAPLAAELRAAASERA